MGEVVDLRTFYAGKRVLITGDTGFKGSWLALWLHELGAEVAGFALPPQSTGDHYRLLGLEKLIRHRDGDIRDLPALQGALAEFKPEILFHLAAQSLVRRSFDEPKLTFDTNVAGSVNVLEAARGTDSLRALVFITSDKCYSNKEWIWGYRENDELGGRDPYSASKAAAELVFAAYVNSFLAKRSGLGAASARAGNVIGGGDWAADRIVPDCMRALVQGKAIVLRSPDATRPWQHVLEPLSGYLELAIALHRQPEAFCGAWNFGPAGSASRSVQELAQAIIANWGSGTLRIERPANPPHEAMLLQLNCDKAHQELGWRSRWNFARTAEETTLWYRKVHDGALAMELSRAQIRNYMESPR